MVLMSFHASCLFDTRTFRVALKKGTIQRRGKRLPVLRGGSKPRVAGFELCILFRAVVCRTLPKH